MAGRSVRISLDGVKKITKDLSKLSPKTLNKAKTACNYGASIVQSSAKMLQVPDTGALRASIHVRPAITTGNTVEAAVYTTNDHAAYEEFGTGRRGAASGYSYGDANPKYDPNWPGRVAKPYLGPAAFQSRKAVERSMKKIMEA